MNETDHRETLCVDLLRTVVETLRNSHERGKIVSGQTDSSFTWGSIVRLGENMTYPIRVNNEVVLVADVFVAEDAEGHVPTKPPPDVSVKKGGGAAFTQDGVYVVQVDSEDQRLTVVVNTDLGELADMMASPEEIA